MFRPQLVKDLQDVFGYTRVRITDLDDESEVLYFNPLEIVSTPNVGSGTTHFRVYGELGVYQDEANGKFGQLHHRWRTTKSPAKNRIQFQGDEEGRLVNLLQQHKILTKQKIVWQGDVSWNEAPDVAGGTVTMEDE